MHFELDVGEEAATADTPLFDIFPELFHFHVAARKVSSGLSRSVNEAVNPFGPAKPNLPTKLLSKSEISFKLKNIGSMATLWQTIMLS